MADDDLSAPLGQKARRRRGLRLPAVVPQAIAALLGLCLAVFAGWAVVVDDPLGGEPTAVAAVTASLQELPAVRGPRSYDGPTQAQTAPPPPAGSQTVTIIDGSTGKRQEVSIGQPPAAGQAAADRLLDTSRHGPIPRIGADGARPADVYARVFKVPAGKPKAPQIAIVVSGLGTSTKATEAALDKLPPAMTLAFMPYANDADRFVTRARAEGREVLLQLPMEPFDYPDNDPGPQTLLASLSAEQNIDRLHWLMSRFRGYVGVGNFMGARFTASETNLGPVLRDVARRGLIYFDDGTSPRSLASQVAGANNMPFAKADIVLDAVPTPVNIDRALTRLEAMARERGSAIGVTTVLPAAIERLAQWAKAAEGRGIVLVPVSALAAKARSS